MMMMTMMTMGSEKKNKWIAGNIWVSFLQVRRFIKRHQTHKGKAQVLLEKGKEKTLKIELFHGSFKKNSFDEGSRVGKKITKELFLFLFKS